MTDLSKVFGAFETFLEGIDDLSPADLNLLKDQMNSIHVTPGAYECRIFLNQTIYYINTQIEWKINNP